MKQQIDVSLSFFPFPLSKIKFFKEYNFMYKLFVFLTKCLLLSRNRWYDLLSHNNYYVSGTLLSLFHPLTYFILIIIQFVRFVSIRITLQMREGELRETGWLTWGHTASKQQKQDLNPGCLAPEHVFLTANSTACLLKRTCCPQETAAFTLSSS